MNDLDGRVEFTLSKFSGDTKAGGVADILVVCAAIQRDLKNLEKWGDRNLMEFDTSQAYREE